MDNYSKERGCRRVQGLICDKHTVVELSSDFSLPDYQPQIKRLLWVRATVSPPDKYIGAGSGDFSGTVDYCVLYSGNDGALYSANETQEYRFSIPVEMTSDFELNDGITCDVSLTPDMTVGRVAAPRKFSVKCRLKARVRLWGTRLLEETVAPCEASSLQRLCGETRCARLFVGCGEALQLGDELLLDGKDGDLRVISSEAKVFVSEVSAGSGVVNCRGEAALKLLCAHEESTDPPTVYLRRIPFAQSVPTDGAEINCDCCAHGVCTDVSITVEEGRILCELAIRLHTKAQRNEELTYTKDIYSTSAACNASFTPAVFPLALKCLNGNVSLNTALTLEEAGIRTGMRVVDLSMIPTVTALECDGGKYRLLGRCRTQVVFSDGEDLSVQEIELPFRYETDGTPEAVTDYEAFAEVISCRARMDGERIAIDAELAIALCTQGETRVEMLGEANFGDPYRKGGSVWTVCYPAPKDTLWSVAKRYHRTVEEISRQNNLSGAPAADSADSLSGVSFLLV